MKKILLLSHSQKSGGAERCLLEAAIGLKKRGYEVTVFMPSDGELNEMLVSVNISTLVTSYPYWVHKNKVGMGIINKLRSMGSIVKYSLKLLPLIKSLNPDYVLSNTLCIPCGAIVCKILRKKHVWFIHEFGKEDHNLLFDFGMYLSSKIICLTSQKIFVNSELVKLKYQKYIKKEKFSIINCNVSKPDVDHELLKIKNRGFDLFLIGQIVKGKGQMDAIKAVHILFNEGYQLNLLVIGQISNNDYYKELQNYIITNRLTDIVQFINHTANPFSLIRKFTIGLICSKLEALGRVTIEYMKSEIPVIGANAGNTPFLITNNETGLLYKLKDPEDLANQIKILIKDDLLVKKITRNAKEFANGTFNEENYIDGMIKYLC